MNTSGFLVSLPKVSLHDHLDGAIRTATVLELSGGRTGRFSDPGALSEWMLTNSESGSLDQYLSSFAVIGPVLQVREALERVASEYVEDLVADGVVYAEVRWAPEAHTSESLTLEQAVDAVQRGLDSACSAANAAGHHIHVTQILIALRHQDASLEIARLVLERRHDGVVAFDLAGPEAGYPAHHHRAALDLLAENLMPVTIHAGEGDGLQSIRSALVDGRALRLGHGARLAEDLASGSDPHERAASFGALATWVLDRQIALELSPTSNRQTGAIAAWGDTLQHHPFDLLYRGGFAVTVNTDNRTLSSTTLTTEIERLSNAFGYRPSDWIAFQLNAASAAFLPHDEKEALVKQIIDFRNLHAVDDAQETL
jgi:adenosine deaminase